MALTTKANVLLIASELSSITDDNIWNLILSDVDNLISSSVFGLKTEMAARYLVAHQLTLINDKALNSASGPIVKDKVGDVMKEYARPQKLEGSEADYNRTGYGRTFLSIRNKILVKISTVIPNV